MNIFSRTEEAYVLTYESLASILLKSNFSEIDKNTFIAFLDESLDKSEIQDLIISSIIDKAKILTKIVLPTDKTIYNSYCQFVKVLCKLKSTSAIDALETYFIKNNELDLFFILLQEKVNHNLNIESAIDSFTYLITSFNYKYETLDKFLKIIGKDHKYLVSLYLKEGQFLNLKTYIWVISKENISYLDDIIPIVISSFIEKSDLYYDLIRAVLYFSNKHFSQMMTTKYKIHDFEDSLFIIYGAHFNVINNYCNYLQSISEDSFRKFENKFINKSNALSIYNYAISFEQSNKRLALLKLLSFEDDSYAASFIKNLPEYKNLLSML